MWVEGVGWWVKVMHLRYCRVGFRFPSRYQIFPSKNRGAIASREWLSPTKKLASIVMSSESASLWFNLQSRRASRWPHRKRDEAGLETASGGPCMGLTSNRPQIGLKWTSNRPQTGLERNLMIGSNCESGLFVYLCYRLAVFNWLLAPVVAQKR